MQSEPGLIEFLTPDERAFGPTDGGDGGLGATFVGFDGDQWADQPDSTARSSWVGAMAGVAVTALLVGGVLAAAPWSGDDASAGPTTVVLQATTVPLPTLRTGTATPVDASRTGWLLDPVPVGLRPRYFARAEDLGGDGSAWGEVWASPGATRVSGRWFSLTLLPFREFSPGRPERWFPVDVAGRPGHARVAADGVVSLTYDAGAIDSSRLVSIDAYGMGLEQMTALADSIAIVDDRPQLVDDRPEFTRPELRNGLDRIVAAATDMELTTSAILGGTQRTRALYSGPGQTDVALIQEQTLDVAAAGGNVAALIALAFTPVPLADGWGPKGGFAGEDLVVGYRTIDEFGLTLARWVEGETEVSLLTTGDLGDLLELLRNVELASAEDWAAAEQSIDTTSPAPEARPRTPPGITVDAGVLVDGTNWSVTYWHSSDEWDVRVGSGTFSAPRSPPTTVTPVTVGGVTLVLVNTDVADAMAVITFADGSSTSHGLAATDPADRTSFMGVVPIESARGYTVEVVAVDGAVMHRFAPWEPESVSRSSPGSGGAG